MEEKLSHTLCLTMNQLAQLPNAMQDLPEALQDQTLA